MVNVQARKIHVIVCWIVAGFCWEDSSATGVSKNANPFFDKNETMQRCGNV